MTEPIFTAGRISVRNIRPEQEFSLAATRQTVLAATTRDRGGW
jgi:hypothetical protein